MYKKYYLIILFILITSILNTVIVSGELPRYRDESCVTKGTFTKTAFAIRRTFYTSEPDVAVYISMVASSTYNPIMEFYVVPPKPDIWLYVKEAHYYYHSNHKNDPYLSIIKSLLVTACNALASHYGKIPICSVAKELLGTGSSKSIDVSQYSDQGVLQYIVGVGVNCKTSYKGFGGIFLVYGVNIPYNAPANYGYGWYKYLIFFTVNQASCIACGSQVNSFEYHLEKGTYIGDETPRETVKSSCFLYFVGDPCGGGGNHIGGCSVNRPGICMR